MSRLTKIAPRVGQTDFLLKCAGAALAEARVQHPQAFVDYNHMMGVLDEEIYEVRTEVYRKRLRVEQLQTELLQVIAVCLRGLEDLTLKGGK
jgi:hypothetical protein